MTLSSMSLELAMLGWGILCGAMIYEHVAVIPVWARTPPASLTMWRGEHRLRAERFWMSIHPILIVVLVAALISGWSDGFRRDRLAIVLAGYAVVIAVTAAWFVPELMRLTRDPDASPPVPAWGPRARRWERLSLARGALLVGLAFVLLDALAR